MSTHNKVIAEKEHTDLMGIKRFEPNELIPALPGKVFTPSIQSVEDLLNLGSENLQQLIRYHRKTETRLREKLADENFETDGGESDMLRTVRSKIGRLVTLKGKADKKPVFPSLRPIKHFNLNDRVVCYIGDWPGSGEIRKVIDAQWAYGTILGGPRYSVRFDVQVHSGDALGGHYRGYFVVDPHLMHQWEFEYLIANKQYLRIWVRNTEDYAKTPGMMYAQMQKDSITPVGN